MAGPHRYRWEAIHACTRSKRMTVVCMICWWRATISSPARLMLPSGGGTFPAFYMAHNYRNPSPSLKATVTA